jgi:hypothetical protein
MFRKMDILFSHIFKKRQKAGIQEPKSRHQVTEYVCIMEKEIRPAHWPGGDQENPEKKDNFPASSKSA